MLANIYSKSYLYRSEALAALSAEILYRRLIPLLRRHAVTETPIDIYPVFLGTSMDFITAFSFGLAVSSNFTENAAERRRWLDLYQSRYPYAFYAQELQGVTSWLRKLGVRLVPKLLDQSTEAVEAWCADLCDAAGAWLDSAAADGGRRISPAEFPVAYNQLRESLRKLRSKTATDGTDATILAHEHLEICSEMCDHISTSHSLSSRFFVSPFRFFGRRSTNSSGQVAGHETSGITLTYITYELSRDPSLQDDLRKELLSLYSSFKKPSPDFVDKVSPSEALSGKDIDELPLLNAIILETLRLYPPGAGGQARVTPYGKRIKLGTYDHLPGGIRVGARAFTLHQNADVFPCPKKFLPRRWLDATPDQLAEMHRWFWAFGSGGRMCIGSNFAIHGALWLLTPHKHTSIYSSYHSLQLTGFDELNVLKRDQIGHRNHLLAFPYQHRRRAGHAAGRCVFGLSQRWKAGADVRAIVNLTI